MQKVTDVLVQGEDESGNGFESLVLKDASGAQYQLFINAGALELVKLEPEEAEVTEVTDPGFEDALAAFEEIFGRCTDPNCDCKR